MWADNETSEDLLGFKVHADLLIDVISDDSVLPVTIGVFGDWGSGKSSILQLIKKEFDEEKHAKALCIYFNGWTFEGYDDAKAALLNAILKELESNKKLLDEVKTTVKEKAKKLIKSVNWMRGAGLLMKKIALPAAAAYLTGGFSLMPFAMQKLSEWGIDNKDSFLEKLQSEDGQKLFDSLKKEEVEQEEQTNAIADFRRDFDDLLKATKFERLVVIIDDLDRCTPDRIIDNLEAVKLFLNVPNTAFVIGADPRIVKHAIEHRYKENGKVDETDTSGIVKDYLEKLIQIPYNLPKLSDSEVETYVSLLICKKELPPDEFQKIHNHFLSFREKDKYSVCGFASIKEVLDGQYTDKILQGLSSLPALVPVITQTLSGNPRQVKRFLNTLTLRQRLARVAGISNFDTAVLAKLMVLEYSNIEIENFNQLYSWQVSQKGLPLELKKLEEIVSTGKDYQSTKAEIEETPDLKKWSTVRVVNWLKAEPQLADIDLSDYFWLSRDKIASTIPGSSLIPTIVKNNYQKLDVDSMTDSVSNKIIQEDVLTMSELEQRTFLEFASQNLVRNPSKKRAYDIFHRLLDNGLVNTDSVYAQALDSIPTKAIPPAVGVALQSYSAFEPIKKVTELKFRASQAPAAKANKTR